jgi:NADPH:quinone reductase-like Zn-dependent oxidoreductase
VLHVASVPVPTLRPGEVLVRVAAASVNAADTIFRSGKLRLLTGRRFPRGTGYDFAGEVVELGEGVTGFSCGMQVWGFAHPRLVKSPPAHRHGRGEGPHDLP